MTEYDDAAWTKDFENEDEFGKRLDDEREKSAFTSAVQFYRGSRAATLIICTNTSYNTFFVVTKLLKPQEEGFIE